MELLEFKCPKCGYHGKLLFGTQDPDQTLSDLNEDFAYYKLFLCPIDKTFHSINMHDREFDGNCPEHRDTKLTAIEGIPKTCPRCGGALQVTEQPILKPERGQ